MQLLNAVQWNKGCQKKKTTTINNDLASECWHLRPYQSTPNLSGWRGAEYGKGSAQELTHTCHPIPLH
eukprot:6460709-Amphidinium_carterae.1